MFSIDLQIFTNATINAPSTDIIEETLESFEKIFKTKLDTTIWCDINPNIEKSKEYVDKLKIIFPNINITSSLAEGYLKSLNNSQSDYMFMLEHDWKFLSTITNTLEEIIFDMEDQNLWYLLFNKFHNFDKSHHAPIGEVIKGKYIYYYPIDRISNNPHIINRTLYLKNVSNYIRTNRKGALGIEQELTASPLIGAVYGTLDTKATVHHTNGKKLK